MEAVVVWHHCPIGSGSAAPRMIVTRCVDCPYREVERTDSGHDSYETAHGRPDSLGKIQDCG